MKMKLIGLFIMDTDEILVVEISLDNYLFLESFIYGQATIEFYNPYQKKFADIKNISFSNNIFSFKYNHIIHFEKCKRVVKKEEGEFILNIKKARIRMWEDAIFLDIPNLCKFTFDDKRKKFFEELLWGFW